MRKLITACTALLCVSAVLAQTPTFMMSANPISNITATSAVITGTVVNPTPGDTLLVWISMTGGSYHTDTITVTSIGPSAVAIPVTMLSPSTLYSSVRLQGTLVQSGMSGSSAAPYASFSTLSDPSAPQVTFPNAPMVTPYSVKPRFHYNYGCPTATQTRLHWGLTPSLGTYTTQYLLTATGDSAFTISGLSPQTQVYYRIETISNCAVSSSPIQTATTISVPAPYSTCPNAVNITYHSAAVPFTVMPGSADQGSQVTKIKLIASFSGQTQVDSIIGSYTGLLVDTFQLANLPGNTNISYVLQYYNAAGAMDYCTRSFVTAPYPAAPGVFVGNETGISSCNAYIPVTVTAPNGGTVYIEWRPTNQGIFADSLLVCTNCTSGVYVMEVTPLLEETAYYIRTRQSVVPQNVGYSNQISVSTIQGESPAIEILGAIDMNPAGPIVHYNVAANGFVGTVTAFVRDTIGTLVISPTISVNSCFTHNASMLLVNLPYSCSRYDIDLEVKTAGGIHSDTASFRSGCAGIAEGDIPEIIVYPNPTTDIVFVGGQDFIADQLVVINMTGQVVMNRTQTRELSVRHLASGVYMLEIKANNRISLQKFMKN